MVKVKKEMTPEAGLRSPDTLETVVAQFANLRGAKLPENAAKKKQVKAVQRELKEQGVTLDPYKFDLEKEEELMVQPIKIVGPDRRAQFGKSIFDDTWATVKIPARVRRHWKKENQDIIKAREQERKKRGLKD